MTRDLLTLLDRSGSEILSLLEGAQRFRARFESRSLEPVLDGKRVALIWDDVGFRNRVAFELGISLMGGTAVQIPVRLGEREAVDDLAHYLDNWFDAIVVRTPEIENLRILADAARAPIVNSRTRHNHPCEILGDLAFIQSERGSVEGLRVVFVGEATNLCHSWFEAAARLPIAVTQVCPEGFEVDRAWLANLRRDAVGTLQVSTDFPDSLEEADVIYTDCWPRTTDSEERQRIRAQFEPYQITSALLSKVASDSFFLPCPPVTRGEEVSDDAMTSAICRVYEAKAYLLHAQNALLATMLAD